MQEGFQINLLDHGYLRFIESWGSDERIIEAARMSTNKGFQGWGPKICDQCGGVGEIRWSLEDGGSPWMECPTCKKTGKVPGDEKLLKFLYDHKHATPFEMAGMVVEVKAPLMVFREWHRHRTQCLSGDAMIACVTPNDTTYKRTIRQLHDLKHGGVVDQMPAMHRNGYSKAGTAVYRKARRGSQTRVRILPNCQSRLLRVMDESTGEFSVGRMEDVWESGVKELFVLDAGGFSIRASADHPFWTPDGWVQMKSLRSGMQVARMGKVAARERPIPPALRAGIGVWTTMMRTRLIKETDRCYLCNTRLCREELVLDHVIPVAESLISALDEKNLKPACTKCHRAKTDSEQPNRIGMSRRGVRWERVSRRPERVGEEMTYDISVEGPHHNYVANDLVVHNSYNEMSARYTPLPDENYAPTVERCMVVNANNKQADKTEGADELTHGSVLEWLEELAGAYAACQRTYESGLRRGIPKELARLSVPVARYSKMRASANLRNWLAFMTLRSAPNAQYEIRVFSDALGTFIERLHPRTWELFQMGRGS